MNKLKQFFKKLYDKMYYSHNPKLVGDLDFYLVFIIGFVLLSVLSFMLIVTYEFVKNDNVAVMFFELAYAFTGAFMVAYWFFNKERGNKKYSKPKFLDALTETYLILTTMTPIDDVDYFSFWRARYYCDSSMGYLKDYDSSKIEDVLKLHQCRELINEKYEKYKKLYDSQDVIILTKEEALAITNEGNKIGLILKKRLEKYWPQVKFRLDRKKFLNQ